MLNGYTYYDNSCNTMPHGCNTMLAIATVLDGCNTMPNGYASMIMIAVLC